MTMDCPVCGCPTEVPEDSLLVECPCCEVVWLVADHALDRILVGAEG